MINFDIIFRCKKLKRTTRELVKHQVKRQFHQKVGPKHEILTVFIPFQ